MTAARLVRVGRQAKLEQRAFWRNPEYVIFTFLLPLVLLALLGTINSGDDLGDRTDIKAIDFVVPGVLAFAVVVAAYGNLATRIAVLRAEGRPSNGSRRESSYWKGVTST